MILKLTIKSIEYFKDNQPYRTTIEIKSLPTPINRIKSNSNYLK